MGTLGKVIQQQNEQLSQIKQHLSNVCYDKEYLTHCCKKGKDYEKILFLQRIKIYLKNSLKQGYKE